MNIPMWYAIPDDLGSLYVAIDDVAWLQCPPPAVRERNNEPATLHYTAQPAVLQAIGESFQGSDVTTTQTDDGLLVQGDMAIIREIWRSMDVTFDTPNIEFVSYLSLAQYHEACTQDGYQS